MNRRHIVILGNGITGVTAARHIRKRSQDRITIISGETDHHFSRTALMYVFMGDLTYDDTKPYPDDFWLKNDIELKRGWVDVINPADRTLIFRGGEEMSFDELVVATGSRSNKFGWPGQDLDGVQGFYSYQDLESMERFAGTTKHAVIVGGGLIGVEVAEMLQTRGIKVTFLVREKLFWNSVLPDGEAAIVSREIERHGINLKMSSELKEILPDSKGRVRAIVTKAGEEIACEMVFLTAGVAPNIAVAKAAGIECDRGILIDAFFKTSTPHVWSAGDCAQHRVVPPGRRPVEQVWYTGKMQGEFLAANLCGDTKPYSPGIWFNSAKFFDIEYQTYGVVLSKPMENEDDFYWEHEQGEISLRIRFDRSSGAVTGMNVFGLRHRHTIWEHWIATQTPIQDVLANLGAANFDPEFYRQYEPLILDAFNRAFPDRRTELRTRKGLFSDFMKKLFLSPSGRPAAEVVS